MPSTLDIRRRIRSVKSTRQITKAMEMVSAAKMRRAQAAALASRTYANLAWELLRNVSPKDGESIHKIMRKPDGTGKTAVVLMTSNRGLIGGFNAHLAETEVKLEGSIEYLTLGKKGRDAIRARGGSIAADFPKLDAASGVAEIMPLAKLVIDDFVAGKYDAVKLVYMHYVSTLRQETRVMQLLPLAELSPTPSLIKEGEKGGVPDYLFEPTPDQVLEILLPRLVTMQIYQALLETNASEHSARMVAMKNASDAASDLVSELTLDFNQIRQAAITKEISEIVSGSLAIK